MFQAVLQFLVGLISLIFIAEGQIAPTAEGQKAGEAKRAAVVEELDNLIALLPVSGVLGDAIKAALKALAPTLITLLVTWANKSGFFGK